MMTTCCHIIVNQQAGNGQGKKIALALEKLLLINKMQYLFYTTRYPGHASILIETVTSSLKKDRDRIWVVGGDGTLHEVIRGIKKLNLHVPIGYFPSGTGNDFARSLGIPKDLEVNFRSLLTVKEPTPIECFTYEDRNSGVKGIGLNSLGIGFDAEVTQVAKEMNSNTGFLSAIKMDSLIYLWSISQAFRNRQTFQAEIIVDGNLSVVSDILIVAIMKHPYFGGGIKIDPESAVNSHELAIMIIKNFSVPVLLKLLLKVITDGSHIHSPYFQRIAGSEMNIKTKSAQLAQVDGELIEKTNHDFHFRMTTFLLWK